MNRPYFSGKAHNLQAKGLRFNPLYLQLKASQMEGETLRLRNQRALPVRVDSTDMMMMKMMHCSLFYPYNNCEMGLAEIEIGAPSPSKLHGT